MNSIEIFKKLAEAFEGFGAKALLVGGAVRDIVMSQGGAPEPKDLDVEVYGLQPDQLHEALASIADGGRVDAVGKSFGVLKVKYQGMDFDVSIPRRDSKAWAGHKGFIVEFDSTMTIKEALSRRDFTMNAIAMDRHGEFIDPFGGEDDVDEMVLAPVGPAFAEDPLRVLRGMQFAARFCMFASFSMTEMGRKLLPEFETLSLDRVWGEFRKMFEKGIKPSCGLKFLTASWWILKFPELMDLMGLEQDRERHPEGSVFAHTLLTADCAARICMRDNVQGEDRVVAVLAALCHDFGKASTTEFIDGKWCSRGHDKAGEAPTRAFCERIGAPKAITEAVVAIVVEHMCHLGVDENNAARIARRLAVRLDGKVSANILAIVMEADHMARGSASSGLPEGMRLVLSEMDKAMIENAKPKNLLTGEMLISLGLRPGKLFGELQKECYELQLEGIVSSKEEALDWAAMMAEVESSRFRGVDS